MLTPSSHDEQTTHTQMPEFTLKQAKDPTEKNHIFLKFYFTFGLWLLLLTLTFPFSTEFKTSKVTLV